VSVGFVAPVPVRWSDIDMYQHVNHATMVTILEEARVPFLKHAFAADITSTGLLIADVPEVQPPLRDWFRRNLWGLSPNQWRQARVKAA
jgi:hypothetical protein